MKAVSSETLVLHVPESCYLGVPQCATIISVGISGTFEDEINVYTGCPRRNVPDFGRVFLMLKYTDITQNTYIQS